MLAKLSHLLLLPAGGVVRPPRAGLSRRSLPPSGGSCATTEMKATDVQRATMRQGIINKLSSTWSGTAQDLTSTVAQMEAKVFSKSSTYETYVAACHKRISKAAAAAPTQVQQPAPALPAAAAPALTAFNSIQFNPMESEQLLEEVRRFVEANGLSIPHALLTDMDELMGYDTAILASCGVPTIDAARFVAKVKGLRARQQNPPPAAAPAPLTPKSPTESFKKGDAVEFQGLASAKGAALNGHRSTVSEVMASSGRVLVGPFWVEGKVEYKSVPPANLRLLNQLLSQLHDRRFRHDHIHLRYRTILTL